MFQNWVKPVPKKYGHEHKAIQYVWMIAKFLHTYIELNGGICVVVNLNYRQIIDKRLLMSQNWVKTVSKNHNSAQIHPERINNV